jgi:hypothetical protein
MQCRNDHGKGIMRGHCSGKIVMEEIKTEIRQRGSATYVWLLFQTDKRQRKGGAEAFAPEQSSPSDSFTPVGSEAD